MIVNSEFAFTVRELREHLQPILKSGDDAAKVWFTVSVEVGTGVIVGGYLGRKDNQVKSNGASPATNVTENVPGEYV